MKYIKGLDTLRAFAVLLVIYTHWGTLRFKQPWLKFIFTRLVPDGKFGVDVFFVLSGYLITRILLEARKEQQGERLAIVKAFYMRRILRIFPMYLLLILVVAYLLNDDYVKMHIGYYLTYTSNFLFFKEGTWTSLPHTWSLAAEEQFYIIWPWIIIYIPEKYISRLIIAFIGIGIISNLILYYAYGEFGNYLLLPCFSAFGIGAYYAYIRVFEKQEKQLKNATKILAPICIVLLIVHQTIYGFILIRVIDTVLGLACIMFIVKENYGVVSERILRNKFLIWMGKISYGIYIVHFIIPFYSSKLIGYLYNHSIISATATKILTYVPVAYIVNFGLLVAICTLSYRYFETPFLNLKKYFSYGSIKKALPLPTSAIQSNRSA